MSGFCIQMLYFENISFTSMSCERLVFMLHAVLVPGIFGGVGSRKLKIHASGGMGYLIRDLGQSLSCGCEVSKGCLQKNKYGTLSPKVGGSLNRIPNFSHSSNGT